MKKLFSYRGSYYLLFSVILLVALIAASKKIPNWIVASGFFPFFYSVQYLLIETLEKEKTHTEIKKFLKRVFSGVYLLYSALLLATLRLEALAGVILVAALVLIALSFEMGFAYQNERKPLLDKIIDRLRLVFNFKTKRKPSAEAPKTKKLKINIETILVLMFILLFITAIGYFIFYAFFGKF